MEQMNQEMEELNLHSINDISEEFNKLQRFVLDFEETCGDQKACTFENAIKRLQNVQKAIISNALFSPNEEFKEIQTEHLKYLLLPYYMGDVFGRMTEHRKKNLEYSRIYLIEFLKLLDHYGLVTEKQREAYKLIEQEKKYEPTREEKIAQFKEQKELEIKVKNIEKIKDEEEQRNVIETQCKIYILKTIDILKTMGMEFEILAYQDKIKNDQEAKEIHENSLKKPLPKLKYWNVPKPQQNKDIPYLLNSQEHQQAMCHSCEGKTLEEIKQIKKGEVWRPDTSLPTVRLEELADMYMADMAKVEEQKKIYEKEEAYRKENIDSDHEDQVEEQRVKDSNWDNWKDENEKGEGNRMGK